MLDWYHNAYYHRLLLGQLPQRCHRVLDVGCGAGTFAARSARCITCRCKSIDEGLKRLATTLGRAGDATASWIWTVMGSDNTDDDVTIVSLRRP